MRYGMMIELDKCIGCQACVSSCKERWNTGPGAFRDWVMAIEQGKRGAGLSLTFYPGLCNHCADHPCTRDCPTRATYANKEGVVVVDPDVCIGCGNCIPLCPYNARHADARKKIVEKCNFCAPYVARGEEPACVRTCLAECRHFGDLDAPKSPLSRLIRQRKAQPLTIPSIQIGPKVYYAPAKERERIIQSDVIHPIKGTTFTWLWQQVSRPVARYVVPPVALLTGLGGILLNIRHRRLQAIDSESSPTPSQEGVARKEPQEATEQETTEEQRAPSPAAEAKSAEAKSAEVEREGTQRPTGETLQQTPTGEELPESREEVVSDEELPEPLPQHQGDLSPEEVVSDEELPELLPRHRLGMRFLHWFNALSWVGLLLTGTALMITPAFALFGTAFPQRLSQQVGGQANLIRLHVVWGLIWAVVIVPLFLYYKRGGIEALREILLTRDDLRWLLHKPMVMLGLTSKKLPPQDKYNAGQKLFALSALAGTLLIIASGLMMTFHWGSPAFVRKAILLHKVAIMLALVGVAVHVTMAAIMAEERPALRSMLTGYVEREHAKGHSTRWVEELASSAKKDKPTTEESSKKESTEESGKKETMEKSE